MIDTKTLQKGQPVALVLTVDDIIPNTAPGGAYIQLGGQEIHSREFKVSIGYWDDEMGEIYASPDIIIPAPREGEYRLTEKDMYNLIECFVDFMDEQHPGDMCYVRIGDIEDGIKRWLENRKEEA